MSRLGIPAGLVDRGSALAQMLAAQAATAQEAAARSRAAQPGLIAGGLLSAADRRMDTARAIAQLQAERADGLQRALLSGTEGALRSIDAGRGRRFAASEAGKERASRENDARLERISRSDEAQREREFRGDENFFDRETQRYVADVGASSRVDAARARSGDAADVMADRVFALEEKRIEAMTGGDKATEQRIAAQQQAIFQQAWEQAQTDEERSQIAKQAAAYSLEVGPNSRPAPPQPGWFHRLLGDTGNFLYSGATNAINNIGNYWNPRSGAPPAGNVPLPWTMDDFYRSLQQLPEPAGGAGGPLLQPVEPLRLPTSQPFIDPNVFLDSNRRVPF